MPILAGSQLRATNLVPRDGGGVVEVGPEGNNGATWAPGGPFDNVYHFTSDAAIPEPSSIIMLAASAPLARPAAAGVVAEQECVA